MKRLSIDNVPRSDFDAPLPGPKNTSAALVAAYGMLLIHEAEVETGHVRSPSPYLAYALRILSAIVSNSLAALRSLLVLQRVMKRSTWVTMQKRL